MYFHIACIILFATYEIILTKAKFWWTFQGYGLNIAQFNLMWFQMAETELMIMWYTDPAWLSLTNEWKFDD